MDSRHRNPGKGFFNRLIQNFQTRFIARYRGSKLNAPMNGSYVAGTQFSTAELVADDRC